MHAVLEWSAQVKRRQSPISVATLDLEIQQQAASILRDNLRRIEDSGAGNSSALVVDTATGDILAWVGSRDFFSEEHKGAIDFVVTKRSPGSALKPFLYALGLEKGAFTAASELPDTQMEVRSDTLGAYLPENINHTFMGPMLLREALANSRNIPALRVLSEVGVEPALRFFESGGVKDISWEPDRYGLGLAVGNLPVTLEELARLYGALAREGESLPLRRFVDEPPVAPKRLLHRETAQLVRHLLADPQARRPMFPVGGPLDFPVCRGGEDGHEPGLSRCLGGGVQRSAARGGLGGQPRLAADARGGRRERRGGRGAPDHGHGDGEPPLLAAILDVFPPPDGAVAVEVCPLSGRLASTDCPHRKSEWFFPGSAPTERCPFHAQVKLDRRNGLRAGPACPKSEVITRVMLDLPDTYTQWAKRQHLDIAPRQESPLCPSSEEAVTPKVAIREPRGTVKLLFDPDTPAALSTLRLEAEVTPSTEPIVWLVDGVPVATVAYPHEYRWSVTPGRHTITAAMSRHAEVSQPLTVVVED